MTKAQDTTTIERATNRQWSEWVADLDAAGARDMGHTKLAQLVRSKLGDSFESGAWWAQMITVAYEQHIGRRIPGQLADGTFEIAVSKTYQQGRKVMFDGVIEWFEHKEDFAGVKVTHMRISHTPKRSNWRCNFPDGSKFAATVEGSGQTSKIVLSHTALPSKQEADRWRKYWREILQNLV